MDLCEQEVVSVRSYSSCESDEVLCEVRSQPASERFGPPIADELSSVSSGHGTPIPESPKVHAVGPEVCSPVECWNIAESAVDVGLSVGDNTVGSGNEPDSSNSCFSEIGRNSLDSSRRSVGLANSGVPGDVSEKEFSSVEDQPRSQSMVSHDGVGECSVDHVGDSSAKSRRLPLLEDVHDSTMSVVSQTFDERIMTASGVHDDISGFDSVGDVSGGGMCLPNNDLAASDLEAGISSIPVIPEKDSACEISKSRENNVFDYPDVPFSSEPSRSGFLGRDSFVDVCLSPIVIGAGNRSILSEGGDVNRDLERPCPLFDEFGRYNGVRRPDGESNHPMHYFQSHGVLDFSFCDLTDIEPEVEGIHGVRALLLSGNSLSRMIVAESHLSSLLLLDLSGNGLGLFPTIEHCSQLKTLNLDDNAITYISLEAPVFRLECKK